MNPQTAIMVELNPFDPDAGEGVFIRATSHNDARVTALNNVQWTPAVVRQPSLTVDLFDGSFAGEIDAQAGDIALALSPLPQLARMAWADRPVKIWAGPLGGAWPADFALIFDGFSDGARTERGVLSLGLKPRDDWWQSPVAALTFAGTGGAEGGADLAGRPKPLAIGAPRNIEPMLVDAVNNVYMFHGAGSARAVTGAFDNGTAFGASVGNFADYAALAAANVPAGRWATARAAGLVRLGAPPAGLFTLDVEGDNGSALGWARLPGTVMHRLALLAGAAAGQIDTASLTALDTAVPYPISLYITQATPAAQLIQQIAQSCNAAAGINWLSKLFAARTVIGAPAITLASDGTARPPVATVERLETSSPFWRMQMGAERAWRVHSFSEIAFAAPLEFRGAFDAATEYREGNIVEHLGFQYLYTATAPSTGNTPPNVSFWQKMSGGEPFVELAGPKPIDLLRDDMNYASAADFLAVWNVDLFQAGEITPLAGLTDVPGGRAMRFGDAAGNDQMWKASTRLSMDYDGVSIYEVGVIMRRMSGVGAFFCGLEGIGANGLLLNTAGANTSDAQHFLAADAFAPLNTNWTLLRGYVRGWSGSPSALNKNDPAAPGQMFTGTVKVRAVFIANAPSISGQTDLAALWLRRLDGAVQARNTISTAFMDLESATRVADFQSGVVIGQPETASGFFTFEDIPLNEWFSWPTKFGAPGLDVVITSVSGTLIKLFANLRGFNRPDSQSWYRFKVTNAATGMLINDVSEGGTIFDDGFVIVNGHAGTIVGLVLPPAGIDMRVVLEIQYKVYGVAQPFADNGVAFEAVEFKR